jgi:hypothetical protein
MKKCYLVIIFLLISSIFAFSQSKEFHKGLWNNWSVNINIGNSQYFGEVSGDLFNNGTTWATGIWVNKRIVPALSIRGQLVYGKIKGRADEYSNGNPAYLSFNAKYLEGTLNGVLYINSLFAGYNPNRKIEFYGFGGFGLCNLQGETVDFKQGKTIRNFGYNYGKGINGWEIDGIGNAGMGVQFRLSQSFSLTTEISWRLLNTDELDGFKGGFKWDSYSYNSLGLTYNFGNAGKIKKEPVYEPPIVKEVEPKEPLVVEQPEPQKVEPKVEEKPESVKVEEEKLEVKPELIKKEQSKINVKPEQITIPVIPAIVHDEYRVQILASKKPVNIEKFKKRFGMIQPVKEEYDYVWYRYTVGSFTDFEKANEEAKKIISQNMIYDAFVVMYSQGKRVGIVRRGWLTPGNAKKFSEQIIAPVKTEPKPTDSVGEVKVYAVQVLAVRKKLSNVEAFRKKYKLDYELYETYSENIYRYYVGSETVKAEAIRLETKIRKGGIRDAFVVLMQVNERVLVK